MHSKFIDGVPRHLFSVQRYSFTEHMCSAEQGTPTTSAEYIIKAVRKWQKCIVEWPQTLSGVWFWTFLIGRSSSNRNKFASESLAIIHHQNIFMYYFHKTNKSASQKCYIRATWKAYTEHTHLKKFKIVLTNRRGIEYSRDLCRTSIKNED